VGEPAAQTLPESLTRFLDGSDLDQKVGPVFELVTVDEDGWPHVGLLSVGEVLATGPSELRLALWASSTTTANLRRTGRGLLALVHDGGYCKVRVHADPLRDIDSAGRSITTFRASVVDVVDDRVGYATLSGGIAFELDDPGPAIRRWTDVVEGMRSCA
jgi:hypothetical protein